MIKHNEECYDWNAVYSISGLCAEYDIERYKNLILELDNHS